MRSGRLLRIAILVLGGILALVAVGALYSWGAGRWLASERFASLLNRRPDRFQISWQTAESPLPGRLVVHGLHLAGRTQRSRWSLHADRVRGDLSVLSLFKRHLLFRGVVASGVSVRVARIPRPGEAPVLGQPGIVPEFPQSPEEFDAASRDARRRPRWTIELPSISIERVYELWLERWRFDGPMTARGGLRLRLGREAQVFSSRLDLADAGLSVAGRPAATHLRGTVSAFTSPYAPRRERGWAAVRHVTGDLRLTGRLRSLEFLVGLVPKVPWLSIEGGDGSFSSRLRLQQGRLAPESRAEIRTRAATVDFLDYQARGRAVLSWQVGGDRMSGKADLFECEIRRRGAQGAYARAPRLTLSFASRDLQMDGRLSDLSGAADLPQAEVPDLRYYNAYLPTGSGLAITGGRGVLSSRLTLEPSGRTHGRVVLAAEDVAATGRGLAVRGKCRLDAALASANLRSRRFDLDGSTARCDGVEFRTGPTGEKAASSDWWAEGRIGDGFVVPGARDYLSLEGSLAARDALPVFALFGDGPGARIASLFFRGKEVAVTGKIDLSSASWRAAGGGRAGARLSADARLTGAGGRIDGALLAGIGRRRIGLELSGSDRKIHWRGAEAWFAGSTATSRAPEPP